MAEENPKIRRAIKKDIPGITRLLTQVLNIHHDGRPDLFVSDSQKYSASELEKMIESDEDPIFVASDSDGEVAGYAFCQSKRTENIRSMNDIRTLYIDDLCVDEKRRGKHIGSAILDFVTEYARKSGYYNITLNVWAFNTDAIRFYEKEKMCEQKITMEKIL